MAPCTRSNNSKTNGEYNPCLQSVLQMITFKILNMHCSDLNFSNVCKTTHRNERVRKIWKCCKFNMQLQIQIAAFSTFDKNPLRCFFFFIANSQKKLFAKTLVILPIFSSIALYVLNIHRTIYKNLPTYQSECFHF